MDWHLCRNSAIKRGHDFGSEWGRVGRMGRIGGRRKGRVKWYKYSTHMKYFNWFNFVKSKHVVGGHAGRAIMCPDRSFSGQAALASFISTYGQSLWSQWYTLQS